MRLLIAALALVATPTAASAAWHKATTNHFIVYSDDTPEAVVAKARELELFDATLKVAFGLPIAKQADPNPVSLYLLPDLDAIRRLYGRGGGGVAGFYRQTSSGAVAFMPKKIADSADFDARLVLLHEYGHHFLLGNFAQAFPAWFTEGFSEFVSTFELNAEGAALGRPATHRTDMLSYIQDEPISDLFKTGPKNVAAVYGQGWLLTHYFMTNPARRPLLDKYFRNIHSGMRDPQAGADAFGDLGKLGVAIDTYMKSRRFSGFRVPIAKLPQVEVKVAPMTAGEAAMMTFRMSSTRGVDDDTAPGLYAKAVPVAARYPDDPTVQGWLAEMALDAKQLDAADAAADRALARDPKNFQALLYKGKVAIERAEKAGPGAAAHYDAARKWIVRANKVESDNAEPLWMIYQTYQKQKAPPTDNAVAALYRAAELMPQESQLRIAAMRQHFLDGEVAEGKQILGTLMFNVHTTKDNPVNSLVVALEAGKAPGEAIRAFDKEVEALRAKAEAKRKAKEKPKDDGKGS